jgi:soluble lytic murein transglycosylase-like protein
MPVLMPAALAAAAALTVGSQAAPAPDAVVPSRPSTLARRIAVADVAVHRAIRVWRTEGRPARGAPPPEVTLWALYHQRALRLLARRPRLAAATIRHLPAALARDVRAVAGALRRLRRLSAGWPPHRVRVGAPEPVGRLLGYYGAAHRRFDVGWHVLAAVNLVESAFGRLRNNSVSGAQGPMQFMPATWRAYGMGGDVHDPRDAILGAANYLAHSGAPRSYSRALYAYNPSPLYVAAVRRYARWIAHDREAVYLLYSWQVYVRTPTGERRVTGPGITGSG